MKYIRIPAEASGDGKPAPGQLARLGTWILRQVIPSANPDFEGELSRVAEWWIEVDDRGSPERELGIARDGRVLCLAPFRDNVGVVTDSSAVFLVEEDDPYVRARFEEMWRDFERQRIKVR
jgi:hypothetical protein